MPIIFINYVNVRDDLSLDRKVKKRSTIERVDKNVVIFYLEIKMLNLCSIS